MADLTSRYRLPTPDPVMAYRRPRVEETTGGTPP
jgi:hypothetical protein